MTSLRVLGLDLSITATGVADDEGRTSTIKGKASEGDHRLLKIQNRVAEICQSRRIEVVFIEDLPTHAHGAGITGMVHGAVRTKLIELEIPYFLITPATLKTYATGKGNAGKPDMRMELFKRFGVDLSDDNQVDAWWLRALGLDAFGRALAALPQTHRRALDKVDCEFEVASW